MHKYLSGFAAGAIVLALALIACGSTDAVRCQLDAIVSLPRDPDLVTLGQAKAAARALRACEQRPGDAGQ